MGKLDCVFSVPLFSEFDADKVDIVMSVSNVVSYDSGTFLAYEGDTSSKLMFVVSGSVMSYKTDKVGNEIYLTSYAAGDMLSDLSSLDSIVYRSSLEFSSDSIVLEVDFSKFKEFILPLVMFEFMELILANSTLYSTVVNRLCVYDAVGRVAFMLSNDLEVFNSLKRLHAAHRLNISAETLSRVLTKLQKGDIIEVIEKKVTILDSESLEELYSL